LLSFIWTNKLSSDPVNFRAESGKAGGPHQWRRSEDAFGHRDLLLAGAAARPAFDFHGDRRGPDLDDLGVAGDLVADEDRAMEVAVTATVAVRPFARRVARVPPARSICDSSHPPKMSPHGLVLAGMAMARSAGSVWGGFSVVSLASMKASVMWTVIAAIVAAGKR
jgi:hypothetical protein